jgi:hypothetical protein
MSHTLTIRPAWTPLTIFLMVIGFIVAWPLGLLMLAYILWGDRIPELRRSAESFRYRGGFSRYNRSGPSGNAAFDEYRRQELRRLDEERRRLDEERREFEAYVWNLRRAKDQEEFDRFMAQRQASSDRGPDTEL